MIGLLEWAPRQANERRSAVQMEEDRILQMRVCRVRLRRGERTPELLVRRRVDRALRRLQKLGITQVILPEAFPFSDVLARFGLKTVSTRALRQALDEDVSCVFDVKQAVRAGFDPYDMVQAMGGCLEHVHLNDNRPGQDCLVPFQGEMDYPRLFEQLCGQGFSGAVILEVYRSNFREVDELSQAAQTLGELLRTFHMK